jgi:hypothetical protein
MRQAGLMAIALLSSACFVRVQGGYAQPVPVQGVGGGALELSAGLGDVRVAPRSVAPSHLSLDGVGHLTPSGNRLGLGVSAAWEPLAGWAHDWSPQVRLGVRALQVEWLPSQRATGSLSAIVEAGVVFFPGRETRSRLLFSLDLAAEGFVRYGLPLPPGFQVSLRLGVGFGNSVGPTS